MPNELAVDGQFERLRNRGDAHDGYDWPQGDPDYVAEYSLTAEQIPALVALATQWIDDRPDDASLYGPVHAWRALGQLRAVEAIQPLLDMQAALGKRHDDWYLEEFPHVFGMIGSPAIKPLAEYMADESHGEYPRISAAAGLREVARYHAETRAEVVAILTAELASCRQSAGDLNGFLAGNLLELKAVESAETIERAFAARLIDPMMFGDWGDIRKELGVPGLGLAPDESPGLIPLHERFDPPPEFRADLDYVSQSEELRDPAADRRARSNAKRDARAKRKAERKNRKRNRKPR